MARKREFGELIYQQRRLWLREPKDEPGDLVSQSSRWHLGPRLQEKGPESRVVVMDIPDTRTPREKIEAYFDKPRPPRPVRRPPARPKAKTYVPKPGNQAAPLWGFWCRRSGHRLATCRGTIHHVMGEAEAYAKAGGRVHHWRSGHQTRRGPRCLVSHSHNS